VWIGTGIGIFIALMSDKRLRKYLPGAIAGVAVIVIFMLATVPSLRSSAAGRVGDQRSVWDRQNTNAAAFRIIMDRPLEGVGWEKFLDVGTNYVRQADTYPITNVHIEVHDVFLSRAAELGIPGAALFVACLLAGPGLALLSRRRQADDDLAGWWYVLVGAASVWLVVALLSPLPYPLPNSLLWLVTGIALTPYLTRTDAQPRIEAVRVTPRVLAAPPVG
jgi:O-antigen ligase